MRFRFCPVCAHEVDSIPPFCCPSCSTWQWRNPKPCAGILLEVDNRVLLLRRAIEPWKGYWDVPGGFVEGGEHPEDAAIRETKEELGIDVELSGLIGIWMDTYGDNGEDPDTIMNVYYLVRLDERPTLDIDTGVVSEIQWFGVDDNPSMGFIRHQPALFDAWRRINRGEQQLTPLPQRGPSLR